MASEPRLSADYAPFLQQLAAAPPIPSLPIEAARAMWDLMDFGVADDLRSVRDLAIPGDAGDIPARLYLPAGEPAALVVFYHGGGWVLGGLKSHDKAVRALTRRSGCAFVAVDYRLAPEHPFPAGLDDAVAAVNWAAANAGSLECAGKPLIVAGDSAGGNLAAAVAIHARDAGTPAIGGQLLIYPATDAHRRAGSYAERASGGLLSAADMEWFWNHYLPDRALADDPRASVERAATLGGLPPTLVATAEFDPLRDDGIGFAARLSREGTGVTHLHFDDQPHGFLTFLAVAPSASAAVDRLVAALKALVAGASA